MERAAWLTSLAPTHAEPLQVVHYCVGEQYEAHLDHFTARDKHANERMGEAGNRLVSAFVYLQPAVQGGETAFPLLGLNEALPAGAALIWVNIDPSGRPDARTLHSGRPLVVGEKYGMNIWLRQQPLPSGLCCPEADGGDAGSDAVPVASPTPWGKQWPSPPPMVVPSPAARTVRTLKERTC